MAYCRLCNRVEHVEHILWLQAKVCQLSAQAVKLPPSALHSYHAGTPGKALEHLSFMQR
jgi:hypothetical protein